MKAIPVRPVAEVRERLSQTLARFRREGTLAEPIVFGSHRKPEAVLLPYAVYEELIERTERLQAVARAATSVRAEGLEPSQSAVTRAERWVRGEISEDEMYNDTIRQYRRS